MTTGTETIDIYTDGACSGNPGPGGWGVLILRGADSHEMCGGEAQTTNNRMELTAAIEALEGLAGPSRIRLHTDSTYVRDGITKWIRRWKANGWKTAARKPVKNVDLWRHLDKALGRHEIEWLWVRGHTGNPGNERADALARRGIPCAPNATGDGDRSPHHRRKLLRRASRADRGSLPLSKPRRRPPPQC